MRAQGLTALIFAAAMVVPSTDPAPAQAAEPSTSNSSCNSKAAKDNHPPVASLKATPSKLGATAAQTVTLTASATDPDGDELSYSYTYSGG